MSHADNSQTGNTQPGNTDKADSRFFSHNSHHDLPAPHIVVVCPSCKTSFAVETAVVAALEIPKFHCSRCDKIFVMKEGLKETPQRRQLSLEPTESKAPETNCHAIEHDVAAQHSAPREHSSPREHSLPREHSAPMEHSVRFVIAPPADTISQTSSISRKFVLSDSIENTPKPIERSGAAHRSRLSARSRSLFFMATPLVAVLAVLLCILYLTHLTPRAIDAAANFITPKFAKGTIHSLPPSSLTTSGLKIAFERTRNREIVPVVRGSISNSSNTTIEDVELEAIAFNARGEIIASSRAPLKSALNHDKISALSLDKIRQAQSSVLAPKNEIKGKESHPFTIAILDGRSVHASASSINFEPGQVYYFSARVFSVKRKG